MISVARGYDPNYLLKEVATGRESYYTGAVADGEPPGIWWGAGAATVGLEGEVAAQDMTAVYKHYLDPREDGFNDPSRWDEVYTLGHTGRAYKSAEQLYKDALVREPDADAARRDELRVEASKAERQNVAFLDITFSVQKSVTLLHTAFEGEEVKARNAGLDDEAAEWARLREVVEEAIWAGNNAGLEYLQAEAGYARVGHHGGAGGRWVDAHGWIVASFFQHDSREHDPQLHIHNGLFNRQECADGVWRTLDSRAIYQMKPAAAAMSERTTMERLVHGLGVDVAMRPDGVAREVTLVRPEMRDAFSTRSARITPRTAALRDEFTARYGREPNAIELDGLKRSATEATRPRKSHVGETHEQMLARVRERAAQVVEGGLTGIAHTARAAHAAGTEGPVAGRFDPDRVIGDAIEALMGAKATWSHAEAVAEIDRQLPDILGLPDGPDVRDLLHGLADDLMARVTDVDQPVPGDELVPESMRLTNGQSPYDAPGRRRGTTPEALRSENRLRAATEARDGVRLAPSQVRAFLAELRAGGVELGPDQEAALTGVLTSGARVETLIGPAGTGKSFVVGTIARAWTDPTNRPEGGPERRVFGLATAQVAADVLAAEGLTAANVRAWLGTQHRLSGTGPARPVDGDEGYRLHRGDIVVVDESSMADREDLVAIHSHVDQAGASMLLVGDPRQLASVGAGGVMDLVVEAGARYELTDARRFIHEWEREASLRLRDGDHSVIQEYHRQGRLIDCGTQADAEASASRAWLADTLAGHRSLLMVDTNDQAARVSGGLRDELVRLGLVAEYGTTVRDGNLAGVGDVIQGRRIARDLAGYAGNPRGPKNREHYQVTGVRSDGALEVDVLPRGAAFFPRPDTDDADRGTVDQQVGRERLVLPPEYVAKDVTLAYGVTKHAVQGDTVYSGHPVIGLHTDLNALYEELSRGQAMNLAHVVTRTGPVDRAHGSEERHAVHHDPRAVISTIFDNRPVVDDAHRSATATVEDAAEWAGSTQTAAERFADAAHLAAMERTGRHLDHLTAAEVLGPNDRARIAAEDGTPALTRVLRQAELAGHDPGQVLHDAVAGREFDGARTVSDVLIARVRQAGPFEPVVASWTECVPADIAAEAAAHLSALGGHVDSRVGDLGAQVAAAPPEWALDVLGPVPCLLDPAAGLNVDPAAAEAARAARDEWEARVGAIAVHREIRGLPVLDDPQPRAGEETRRREAIIDRAGDGSGQGRRVGSAGEVLGSAPGREQPEAYASYRGAHLATNLPDYTREDLERSDAVLRAIVNTWEREQRWNSPAYVDNALAATRQAEQHHRHTAELRRAEAAVSSDPDERERLTREAGYSDALADTLGAEAVTLDHAAQTRGEYLVRTAEQRARAHNAREVLADRSVSLEPEHTVTAEEHLAADRAARHEDDRYRDITDIDLAERSNQQVDDRAAKDRSPIDHADTPDITATDTTHPDQARPLTPVRIDQKVDEKLEDAPESVEPSPIDTDSRAVDGTSPGHHEHASNEGRRSQAEPAEWDESDRGGRGRGSIDEDTVHVPDPAELEAIREKTREAAIHLADRASLEIDHQEHERADQLARWHDSDHVAHDASDDDRADAEDSVVDVGSVDA